MGVFRLLLALAVVVAHVSPPVGLRLLGMVSGSLAVQIFYVISGFYMAMVLRRKYVGKGAHVAFLKNRVLRLHPMFLVVLLATLVLGGLLELVAGRAIEPLACWLDQRGHMSLGSALFFGISNLTIVGQDLASFTAVDPDSGRLYLTADFHREARPGWCFLFVPQAWTVGVELMFYAVAPFIVRRRASVVASLMAASLLLRVYIMRRWQLFDDPWTYRFFPTELALFLAGALSFRLYERGAALLQRQRRSALCVMLGAIALVLAYERLPAAVREPRYGLSAILLLIPLIIPWIFAATHRSRVDRMLGELSYPVYIIHYPLTFVLHALGSAWVEANFGAVTVVLTMVLAYALLRFVGEPIERMRSRIGRSLSAPSPS